MNIKGKVKQVMDTQVISEKFSKRDLILTDDSNEKYPQHLAIQFTQDSVNLLDGLKVGEEIDVSINLRGREWTSPKGEIKFFNTIEGWRIENVSTQTGGGEGFAKGADHSIVINKEDDSLPF